jgi:hypothetical protein
MKQRILGSLVLVAFALVLGVRADDPTPPKPKDKTDITKFDDEAIEQEQLAKQFKDFESALLNMANRMERSGKPEDVERAKILKQALKECREKDIHGKFDILAGLLKNKSVGVGEIEDAMKTSKMLAEDIRAIIALLLSDNRDAQLKELRIRVEKLIAMLKSNIREQSQVRAQTEQKLNDKNSLSKSQQKVSEDTKKIDSAMGPKGAPKDAKKGEGQPKDGKKGEGEPKEGGKGKGEPKDGKGSKGSGQPKDGQPKDGEPKSSPPSNSPPQPSEITDARKKVQDAIEAQKKAIQELEKQKNEDASNKQDEALKNLNAALKQLEELLRQLRQEELERMLANLQNRCQRMLAIQIEVYEGTKHVDQAIAQAPDKKATRTEDQRSLQLSDRELEIVKEAAKAIQLLENEGSAIAFLEAFLGVKEDAQHVVRRLGKTDVGNVTQSIERDIIEALKEMIEALKKAQQALKAGKSNPGKPGNPRLIDLLAELKMIRSMQQRVNRRTLTYAEQYTGEQAKDPDIQKELSDLAGRQLKIFDVTTKLDKKMRSGE